MDTSASLSISRLRLAPLWLKGVLVLLLFCTLLVLLLVFFPWDLLRGPIGRYVTEKTGRQFDISGHLDVKLGRTVRVTAEGVEFGNPPWAQERHLVKADAAEVHLRLGPLFQQRIEMPLVRLTRPQLGLQLEPDGRRTWALGADTADERNVPHIGAFIVDQGTAHYIARGRGADIRVAFAHQPQTQAGPGAAADEQARVPLPLRFQAQGLWQAEPFRAQGRTGDVLALSAALTQPFPAQVHAIAGETELRASGTVASISDLDGASLDFQLKGENLAHLYKLVGIVLPQTPRYAAAGHLTRQGSAWHVRAIDGRLGNTDVAGELTYDRSGQVPSLKGQLQSRSLDFEDLAPLVGLEGKPSAGRARGARAPSGKVLPSSPLDVSHLRQMNADVHFVAARITNTKRLPLDRLDVHARLHQGVLRLEPMELGVAGGRVTGTMRIDSTSKPTAAQLKLDARSMELSQLFRGTEAARATFGKVHGEIDLTGAGASVAQLLANASGEVALLMGRGQISNLVLELAGLDAAEVIKFLVRGDEKVQLRCAATSFEVRAGTMRSRAIVLDTADTVFYGEGNANLARESLDLTIRPYPKDTSILSLRSPLKVGGSFGAPTAGPDRAALAGRAAVALALATVNPLLALAATIEAGPGKDADCVAALQGAAAPQAAERVRRDAPPPPPASARREDVQEANRQRMGAGPGRAPQTLPASKPPKPGAD